MPQLKRLLRKLALRELFWVGLIAIVALAVVVPLLWLFVTGKLA